MASRVLRKTLIYNQLRTFHGSEATIGAPVTLNMFKNKEKFQAVLPEVMDSIMSSPKLTKNQLPEVQKWIRQLLDYTMEGGKRGRGLAVPFAYQVIEDPKHFTEDKLHTARFLGWCLEMLQAFILAVDDIIDASTTRRGKECWYLKSNVGSSAINDCVLVNQCFMELLKINFSKEPFYTDLIHIANEAVLHTSIGQFLDYHSGYSKEKNNLDTFTMERFNAIAVQKTAYYSFKLPLIVGLLVVKDGRERDTTELCNICNEFGKLLQFQNDYKDVYLDESITGKEGTDIQEGKLSWIAVAALERCNDAQRAIFKEYYGSKDPKHVKRIKQLYDELQMDKVYRDFEHSFMKNLERRIRTLPREGEVRFFLEILEGILKKIY